MKFNNPYTPTYEEIIEWAYDIGSVEPEQDWDILVDWLVYPDLVLKLASDKNCPSQEYFLHILYVVVGQAVRGKFSNRSILEIEVLFDHAKTVDNPNIRTWLGRSRELIKHPDKFKYDDWFAGKLARS